MSSPAAAAVFVVAVGLSLGASAVLVARIERAGARLGLSEALLGLVAALAADGPEVTAAVTALLHGQHDIGAGVVLGSNVFNLAALIGLGAFAAGGIRLHRRVVIFEGTVALWVAALSIAAVAGLITPVAALVLALAVLGPCVYVSAVHPSGRPALRLPSRLRAWLAGAVAEEEEELAEAISPGTGGLRDVLAAVAALAVVLGASAAMERRPRSTVSDEIRFVQLTPPGSACSIAIGQGITDAAPGSGAGLQLVVPDIEAARGELVRRGAQVSEIQELAWGRFVFFADLDGRQVGRPATPPRG